VCLSKIQSKNCAWSSALIKGFKTADSSDDDDNGELHQGLNVGRDVVIDDDGQEKSDYDYKGEIYVGVLSRM
jgi:hypothetical protein